MPETGRSCWIDSEVRGRNARLQAQEIDVAAAVQRKSEHLLGVDDVAELRAFGLYLHGVGFNADGFCCRSQSHGRIDMQLVVHFHFDVRFGKWTESIGRDDERVSARRQSQDVIRAVRPRDRFVSQIRLRIRDRKFCADDRSLRGVTYHALNRSGYVGI